MNYYLIGGVAIAVIVVAILLWRWWGKKARDGKQESSVCVKDTEKICVGESCPMDDEEEEEEEGEDDEEVN